MTGWLKIEAGRYESKDGRFVIRKISRRGFGPWQLIDRTIENDYQVVLDHETMAGCKSCAERIAGKCSTAHD